MTERTTKGIYYTVGSPTGSWSYRHTFESISDVVNFVRKARREDKLFSKETVIFQHQWERAWDGDNLIEYDYKQTVLTDKRGILNDPC